MRSFALSALLCGLAQAQPVDFARDVQPIFKTRCQDCHGAQQQMSGLRLDWGEAILRGGNSGSVIQPGNSSASPLIQRVSSLKKGFMMPPVGAPLTPDQIAKLRAWIDQGANIPVAAATKAPRDSKSNHWSLQPVRRPTVPEVRNRAWTRNPIDAFIAQRHEAEGILPSPDAGRITLIRRLSLDLIGLLPTPAEVKDFISDQRPDAFERVVERLLGSPHYGEKWGRHWLDLARFADSDGYEKDLPRPNAWRYRQWVIEALNRDMPFDQFTIEQLAGDLLPNATVDQQVATGFQRNTLTNREAGVDRAEARFEQIVNRTGTTGTVWLGLTVGCAQCHNHKFDPISQKEFYQLFAFWNGAEERDIDAPLAGEVGPYLQARPEYDRKRRELLDQYHIPELVAAWELKLRDAYAHPGKDLEWDFAVTGFRAAFDGNEKILRGDVSERSPRLMNRFTDYFVMQAVTPDLSKDKAIVAQFKELREKLVALETALPPFSQAPTLTQASQPPETHIALGGDFRSPGVVVAPGTPAVLPPLLMGTVPERLALARWLVSRENPLTPRVTINRVWQEYFGRGLVRTSDDFGKQGEKPSHPELLDWLASEFMERQWSMKEMHRLIVTSATYRQSSQARKDLNTRDPENVLLARQSRLRLPAELIRDSALSASGLLNPAIGGKSVRPPLPAGVAELGYANNVKWKESTGPDRYRRGLYIHFQRTTPYPQLTSFDAPDSNITCTRRQRSNTPLQALNLLNDPVFFEAAEALAVRTLREAPGDISSKLDYAFEVCLARKPASSERDRLAQYFAKQREAFQQDRTSATLAMPFVPEGISSADAAAWLSVSRVLLNLDEFITRE